MPELFDIWTLGPPPNPDPLDRVFMGRNLRDEARKRDFGALLAKLTRLDRQPRKQA